LSQWVKTGNINFNVNLCESEVYRYIKIKQIFYFSLSPKIRYDVIILYNPDFMMTKLFFILLIFFSQLVSAKWEGAYPSSDGKMTLYYDNETVQVNYPLFRIWSLMDFKSPIYNNIYPTKILTEYSCLEKQRRVVHILSFSENMAEGTIVSQASSSQDWVKFNIDDNSSTSNVFKTICGEDN